MTSITSGTGPITVRPNSLSTAGQDKRLEIMTRNSELTVEEATALLEKVTKTTERLAEFAQAQISPEGRKAYDEKLANALGASVLAKWNKMSATEQEPYIYKTPRGDRPGKVIDIPADFKPDEEIVTMLTTAQRLGLFVEVKMNFKSAPAGATMNHKSALSLPNPMRK